MGANHNIELNWAMPEGYRRRFVLFGVDSVGRLWRAEAVFANGALAYSDTGRVEKRAVLDWIEDCAGDVMAEVGAVGGCETMGALAPVSVSLGQAVLVNKGGTIKEIGA